MNHREGLAVRLRAQSPLFVQDTKAKAKATECFLAHALELALLDPCIYAH